MSARDGLERYEALRERLEDPATEARVQAVWRRIEARRAARTLRGLEGRAVTPAWRWGLAAGFACAAAVAGGVARHRAGVAAREREGAVVAAVDPGPLQRAVSRVPLGAVLGGAARERVALSDGSALELAGASALEVIENTGARFHTALRAGEARVEVRPGGPRRWVLDCGPVEVTVVGTEFTLRREGDACEVRVAHGVVLVQGEQVPDRVQRLGAGDVLRVPVRGVGAAGPDVAAPSARPSASAPAVSASHAATEPRGAAGAGASARGAAWRALAREGRFDAAFEQLGQQGIARAVPLASAEELLALADVARLSGHPADAVAPLEQVLARHGATAHAAPAAFTLGRLLLDALGEPARAAQAFARAAGDGAPAALVEDAMARQAEALARAGQRDAARRVARAWLERFPQGRRAAAVQRLAVEQ